MNVLVSNSVRFATTGDGALWTDSPSLGYGFWRRYLDVFDEVLLLARARHCERVTDDMTEVSGAGIRPIIMPWYRGLLGGIRALPRIRRSVREALAEADAVALRAPCAVAVQVAQCVENGRPYSVEVCGDPWDAWAPGISRHPLARALRWWSARTLRNLCANACAVSYVSEKVLPKRYPAPAGSYSTHFSSIDLTDEAVSDRARRYENVSVAAELISVATLSNPYKGMDVLIDAIGICEARGGDFHLTIVGDGELRSELEKQVRELGLADRVDFTGMLSAGEAVRARLDAADMFVLPSKTEGLPRAMIEAMARGLPCVGTDVGGIRELLPPACRVARDDAEALAAKIMEVASDPARMRQMSARNLEKSKEYRHEVLRERRIDFYQHLREETAEWLKKTRM